MDLFSAQVLVHEHAIYIHESIQYHVDELDWGERKAYVHKIDVDHYTYANRAVTLKPLDVFAEAPATGGRRIHGEVMVASLVTLYKKLKFLTDENVGWGPIDLPELELQTTAYWLTAEGVANRWRRDELDVALLGAGRAIQTVASVLLMVDPRDLGLVTQVRSPHPEAPTIYLYEAVPGGIGLSERLWDRHDELLAGAADLIAACGCEAGCPACTGPRLEPDVDAKALALRLLGRSRGPDRRRRRPAVIDGGSDASPAGSSATGPRTRPAGPPADRTDGRDDLAARLADAVDGEVVRTAEGVIVRREAPSGPLASTVRRSRRCRASRRRTCRWSASTPRRPGSRRRPGRLAFLVGLGWWEARPVPAGPAAAPRPRRGARPADRARGDDPGRARGSSPTTGAASTGRCS